MKLPDSLPGGLAAMAGMKFSPLMLDVFAGQMKGALALAENVPQYVLDSAEEFRKSMMRWSAELKEQEKKKTA